MQGLPLQFSASSPRKNLSKEFRLTGFPARLAVVCTSAAQLFLGSRAQYVHKRTDASYPPQACTEGYQ